MRSLGVAAGVSDERQDLGVRQANAYAVDTHLVITHAHPDHYGGAKYLQDTFDIRVLMGAPDWDSVAARAEAQPASTLHWLRELMCRCPTIPRTTYPFSRSIS